MPKWMRALDSFTPGRSLAIGALLSGVNPKNLMLNAAAAASIAQAGLSGGAQAVVLVVLVLVGSLGIIAPVAIYFAMGDRAAPVLDEWKAWLAANNATVMTVLFWCSAPCSSARVSAGCRDGARRRGPARRSSEMTQAPGSGRSASPTRFVMPAIVGVIAVAVLAFIIQNRGSVKLTWLFWSFSWPLWLLLVVTIGLSLVAGQIMLMLRRHRRRVARRAVRRGDI